MSLLKVPFERILANHAAIRRPATLPQVLDQARQSKFDGTLTIHYRAGVAKKVEAGRPAQVDLVEDPLTDSQIPRTLSSVIGASVIGAAAMTGDDG